MRQAPQTVRCRVGGTAGARGPGRGMRNQTQAAGHSWPPAQGEERWQELKGGGEMRADGNFHREHEEDLTMLNL